MARPLGHDQRRLINKREGSGGMVERVGIVGGGIMGLAQAWSAAERGHRVTIFERTRVASGASIRNFGMVWPIGQPEALRDMTLLSRERWLQVAAEAGIWANPYGSLHLAHHADEQAVLQEYLELQAGSAWGAHLQWLDRETALARYGVIRPEGFRGALYSDMEICVNPTSATRRLPVWLQERYDVELKFGQTVNEVGSGWLKTAQGEKHDFERIIICSGHDRETLFPGMYAQLPLRACKLQMLRTYPQATGWQLGAHIASGLTLRHYSSFRVCSSLTDVIERIAAESPELDEFGIHVMASQDDLGRVVLGDSHEYEERMEPFDSQRINELILRELHKIICLPDWRMESQWHGIYTKVPDGGPIVCSPDPGVYIATGVGGAGMTLAFGVAETQWRHWSGDGPAVSQR